MNFEQYLMEILKEEFENMMISESQVDDFDVEKLYRDEDGNLYDSDSAFISAHKDKIFSSELMSEIHMFITKVDVLDEKDLTKLVAYLASQYYVDHYDIQDSQTTLRYLATTEMDRIVELFMTNEWFGRDLLNSFYRNSISSKRFYSNKRKIQEDGKAKVLDRLYNVAFPPQTFTINQKLREVICNLYNYYISRGYPDKEALEITWHYFFNNLDPLHELEELGCDEYQKMVYKKYMLGLIIGDLYEDTVNKPMVDTESYKGRMAQVLPVLLTTFGQVAIPGDEEVRGRMLKYFILLQDNEEKKKSNRKKTHDDGREKQLKKVNPGYILDELTF